MRCAETDKVIRDFKNLKDLNSLIFANPCTEKSREIINKV